MADPPDSCPDCGARGAVERRYVTGGGWRPVYRCRECGIAMPAARDRSLRHRPRDVLAVGAAVAAVVAGYRYLRRKLG